MIIEDAIAKGGEENTLLALIAMEITGEDVFTYKVADDEGAYAIAQVTVTVTAGNQPPVAVDDVEKARLLANKLKNDTEFYNVCSENSKKLYREDYD